MNNIGYHKAINLLHEVASPNGFLASAENTTNYKRVWARDGVICGLAALASGDEQLISTFKSTLDTLAKNQHPIGTIPSNVLVVDGESTVSYGGLAGRVDAVTWFIIGVCQYAYYKCDASFVTQYHSEIEKGFGLLDAWEFNSKHLLYVPLSGNWADEYITDGYVLYDQLLRIWALKSYNYFVKSEAITEKIKAVTAQIQINFTPDTKGERYHERAYNEVEFKDFMPCSFSPSGYKNQFDAFANSLVLLLNIGSVAFQNKILNYADTLASETKLGLLPAFWPPVFETDEHWNLLKNNCKYEFRNFPYEFHNGGSWPMVNGFYGLALFSKGEKKKATIILEKINEANAKQDFSFYENFNTQTTEPNGVSLCAWSAAATVLVHQSLHHNFKILV
ncbi:fructofuranosidase/invertase [Flavobacterium sp. J49]|uniref:glycoside hydrolase 100 family protein n=1 Tax=Flavobacterium sp. J49 TaxID=2718534 RepID=UPI001592C1FC|nr:glycoside hydrolase 100 family protein [Flavobacterium sp. J49]MBF6641165.1 fructofuranosidase/invertase [Flavobacterium sp. J49]NIC02412.1 fructofuranosidase/invertase [Flavobacterium sp. J49]